MTKVLKLATVASLTLAALSAQAASEPAVIYDTAGKYDKSFNEAVFRNGVELYNKDKGVKVKEFEPQNEAQREQGLRRLASRGNGPIVAVGFNMGSAVEKVATEFPKTQFTIIDMVVDKPNVQSVIFKEHEGSFLVGALACHRFQERQGRLRGRHGYPADPQIPVRLPSRVPSSSIRRSKCSRTWRALPRPRLLTRPKVPSWPSPSSPRALTWFTPQLAVPVSVSIRQPRTAASSPSWVDSNQNHLQPGTMLTSMVKSVGLAAYQTWDDAAKGEWKPGIKNLGLAEGGVDWALDKDNEKLITPEMKAKVDAIKAEIIAGKVKVHDYMSDNTCKY